LIDWCLTPTLAIF